MTSHDPGSRMYDQQQPPQPGKPKGRKGHGWMMIACCIPMLVIAIALVATGAPAVGKRILSEPPLSVRKGQCPG